MEALDSGQNEGKRAIDRDFLGSCFVLGWRGDEDELVNVDSSDESSDDIESGKGIFSELDFARTAVSNKVPSISSCELNRVNDGICGIENCVEDSNTATFSVKMPGLQAVEMVSLSDSQEIAIHGTGTSMKEASVVNLPEKHSIANSLNIFATLDYDKKAEICSSESSPVSQESLSRDSLQGVENSGKRSLDEESSDLKQIGDSGRGIPAKRLKAAAQLIPYKKGVVKLGRVSGRLDSRKFRKAFKDKLLGMKSLKHLPNLAQAKQKIGLKAVVSEKGKEQEQSAGTAERAQALSVKVDNQHAKGLGLNKLLKEKFGACSKMRKDVEAFRNQSGLVDSTVNARAEDFSNCYNNSYHREKRKLDLDSSREVHRGKNIKRCADGQLGTQCFRKKTKVQELGKKSISLDGDKDREQSSHKKNRSDNNESKTDVITKKIFSAKAIGRPFDNGNAAIRKKAPEQCSIKEAEQKPPIKLLHSSGCNHLRNSAVQKVLGKLAIEKRKTRGKESFSMKSSSGITKNKEVDRCSKKRNAKWFTNSSSQFQETLWPAEKKKLGKYYCKGHKLSLGMNVQAKKVEATDVLELDQVDGGYRESSRSSNELLVASKSVSKRRKHLHATLDSTLTGKEVQKSSEQLLSGNKVTNTSRIDSSTKQNTDAAFYHERALDGSNSSADNEKWKSCQWVECISCKKWRRIPFDVEISKKSWQCKDNIWDVNFASCNSPQDAIAEFSPRCDSDSASISASRSISVNLPNLAEVIVVGNEALDVDKLMGEGCVLESMKQMELVWVKIDDADGWWPARLVHASDWPKHLERSRLLANEKTLHLFHPEKSADEYMIKQTSYLLPFGEHYNSLKDSNNTTSFQAAVTEAYEMYIKNCEIVEGSSDQVIKEACKRKNADEELVDFDAGTLATVATYETDVIDYSKGGITGEAISVSAGDDADKFLSSQFSSDLFTAKGHTDQQVIANSNVTTHRKDAVLDAHNCIAVTEDITITRADRETATTDGNLCEKSALPIKQTLELCNLGRELLHNSEAVCEQDNDVSCLNLSLNVAVPENRQCSSCLEDQNLAPEGTAVGYPLPKDVFPATSNKQQYNSSELAVIHTLDQLMSCTVKGSKSSGESRSKPMYDLSSQEPETLEARQSENPKEMSFDKNSQKPLVEMKGRLKYQHMRTAVDADEDAPLYSQLGEGDHRVLSSNDAHHSFCEVCGEGGELLCCDGKNCRNTYHLGCLDPPLSQVPKGNWYCPDCSPEVHAVFGEVESIWDAQKSFSATQLIAFKGCADGSSLEDMHYVKWKQRAHIHNRWVLESELLKLAPKKLKIFKMKVQQGQALKWDPEWAVPHRFIGKRSSVDELQTASESVSDCRHEWYVKWKNLGYDKCSWESAEPPLYSIPTIVDLEKSYELRCAAASSRAEHQSMQEAKKLRDSAFFKLNQQPNWVVGGQLLPRQLDVLNELRRFWKNYTSCIVIDGASQERIITTINFVVSLIKEFRVVRPLLVVGPSDTIPVWEAEIAHWAPGINAVVYSGSREAREVIQNFEIGTSVEHVKVQLLVTTFEIFNADVNYLRDLKWEALLIDEGQRIRAAKTFQNLTSIEAEFRVFCSSEKLKINVEDLFHVYSLVEQDNTLLHAKSHSIFAHEDEDAQLEDLRSKINLHIVCCHQCETPPNIHVEYWVPVTMPQIQIHEYCRILVQNYELLQTSRMRPDHGGTLRDLLLKLRECCNHPYLVSPSLQASLAKVIPGRALLDAGVKASGKLQLLDLMLSQLKREVRRVLVLTQTTSLRGVSQIDILEDYLRQQFGVDAYERVDGGLSWQKKQAALQRFNARDSDRFVFLMDRRSCGLSIKLSAIDTIIIYDSHWNPRTDVQALFRAHITSNCRKILVYRLYSRHTLEERVLLGAHQTGTSDSQKIFTSKYCQQAVKWGAEALLKLDEQYFVADFSTSDWELQFSKPKFPLIVNNTLERAEDEVCLDAETVKLILGGAPDQLASSSSVNQFIQKVLFAREMGPDGNETTPLLYGVTQECHEEESKSWQDFWNRVLKEKFEQWQAKDEKRDSRKGQRARKKVQYDESGVSSIAPFDVSQERCKRRKILDELDMDAFTISETDANERAGGSSAGCDRIGLKVSVAMPAHRLIRAGSPGHEAEYVGLGRKVLLKAVGAFSDEINQSTPVLADSEVSRMPIVTDSHAKSTTSGASPTIADESFPAENVHKYSSQEIETSKTYLHTDQEEQNSSEKCSECAKTVRSVQKQLHMAMKPELANLCQILDFSKDVAEHAGELLGFVVHNFRMPKEPRSLVHAVELSLCWVAAERLGLDINFMQTLSLAKEHLDFKMKDQQLKLTYEKLKEQCMRYKSTSLPGKPTNELGVDSLIESHASHSGLQEPNPVLELQEPREVSMRLQPGQTTVNIQAVPPSQSQNPDAVPPPPPLNELRPQQPHLGASTLNENMPRLQGEMSSPQTCEHALVEPVEVHLERSAAVPQDGQCLNTDSLPFTQHKSLGQQLDLVNGSQLQPEQVSPGMLASLKDQLVARKVERMRSLLNQQKVEFCNFESYSKRERESLRHRQVIDHAKVMGAKMSEIDMRSMLVHQEKLHAFQVKRLEERLQKERRELANKQTTDREKENKSFAVQMEHFNAGRTSLLDLNVLKSFVETTMVSSVSQAVLPQLSRSTGPLIPREGELPESAMHQADLSTEVETLQCMQQNLQSYQQMSASPNQQEQGVQCSLPQQCDTDVAPRVDIPSYSVSFHVIPLPPPRSEGVVASSSLVQQESQGQPQRIPEHVQHTRLLQHLPQTTMHSGISIGHVALSQQCFVDAQHHDLCQQRDLQNPNLRPPQTSSTARNSEHLQRQRRNYPSLIHLTPNFPLPSQHTNQCPTSSVPGQTPVVTEGHAALVRDEAHVSISTSPLRNTSLPSLRSAQLRFQDPLRHEEMKLRKEQEKLKQAFHEESTRIKTQYEKEAAALKKKYEGLLFEEHKSFFNKSEILQKNILKVELNRRVADALRMKDLILYSAQSSPGLGVDNVIGGARGHPLVPTVGNIPLGTHRSLLQQCSMPLSTPLTTLRVPGNSQVMHVPALNTTSRVSVSENCVAIGITPLTLPPGQHAAEVSSLQPRYCNTSLPTSHPTCESLSVVANMSTSSLPVDSAFESMQPNFSVTISESRQCATLAASHGDGSYSLTSQELAIPSVTAALVQAYLADIPCHPSVDMEDEVTCILPLEQTTVSGMENDSLLATLVPRNLSDTICVTSVPNSLETGSLTNPDGANMGGLRGAGSSGEVQNQVQSLVASEILCESGFEISLEQQRVVYLSDDD